MEKFTPGGLSDIASRARWSVFLHWYMLGALSISGLFSIFIAEGLSERFSTNLGLLSIFMLSNFIFYFLAKSHRSDRFYRGIVISLIIYELAFITLAMYLNGGLESQIFILYVVPILMATVTLRSLWVYFTAIASVLIISIYLWADYSGLITSEGKLTNLSTNYQYVLNTIVFIGLTILLITYLANYIIRLLRQRERQALENFDALARAQAVAKIGSWEWDITNDVVSWSDQMYKMYGLRPGSKINYNEYLERIYPDDRGSLSRTIQRSLKTGRSYRVMHRVISSKNKVLTILGEGHIIKDNSGKPVKIIGTARDITAEQELEQAKNNFVSLASHQLRTPATEVQMLLSLLKEGYAGELTTKQLDLAEKAHQTNERQMKVANDLLGIAQLNTGRIKLHKAPLELGQWLADIVRDISPMLEAKDQQLRYKPLKKTVTVKVDAERLQLAVENLIENASKYTPNKGTVTLSYTVTKQHTIINVRDTGVGIAKGDQKSIFNIYTRVNSQSNPHISGSGLGLYLVKKIIDLHHGKVIVSSKPNVGSTFSIHLPLK